MVCLLSEMVCLSVILSEMVQIVLNVVCSLSVLQLLFVFGSADLVSSVTLGQLLVSSVLCRLC